MSGSTASGSISSRTRRGFFSACAGAAGFIIKSRMSDTSMKAAAVMKSGTNPRRISASPSAGASEVASAVAMPK